MGVGPVLAGLQAILTFIGQILAFLWRGFMALPARGKAILITVLAVIILQRQLTSFADSTIPTMALLLTIIANPVTPTALITRALRGPVAQTPRFGDGFYPIAIFGGIVGILTIVEYALFGPQLYAWFQSLLGGLVHGAGIVSVTVYLAVLALGVYFSVCHVHGFPPRAAARSLLKFLGIL
ncbi:MAG: hypothetical protein WDA16_02010 [Candidatus Thermoplasmatota archaeon]